MHCYLAPHRNCCLCTFAALTDHHTQAADMGLVVGHKLAVAARIHPAVVLRSLLAEDKEQPRRTGRLAERMD